MADTLVDAAPERPGAMDKAAYFEIAEQALPGGGFGGYKLPDDVRFVIHKGEGSRLQDTDGNWYIDYVGGAGALILGHAPPAVTAAAQEDRWRGGCTSSARRMSRCSGSPSAWSTSSPAPRR